jgi:hypothetical protein
MVQPTIVQDRFGTGAGTPNDVQTSGYTSTTDADAQPGGFYGDSNSGNTFANGPLASLFKPKYNYKDIQYPADLNGNPSNGGSPTKGHAIRFDMYNVRTVTLNEVQKVATKLTKDVISAAPGMPSAIKGTAEGLWDTTKGFVGEATSNPTGTITSIANKTVKYLSTDKTTLRDFLRTKKDLQTTVSLYMPDTLQFTQGAEYGEVSILGAAQSVPGLKIPANGIQSVSENQLAKLALNKLGYAFNPQSQSLFQGIHFRTFNMSFTFTPRSAQEAARVKEIITLFRTYAAPTIQWAAAGFFYTPPGIFNLTFLQDGKENPNINKLQDSVLTSVDVNYAPVGWSAHKDGAPVQTTMDLSFQEIVLVDRALIKQGY